MLTSIVLIILSAVGCLWLMASAWDRKDAIFGGRTDVIILLSSLALLVIMWLLT